MLALGRISRLRKDDHVYRVAASVRMGDTEVTESNVAELKKAFPGFDPAALAASLPYQRDADRQAILDALAGVKIDI